MPSLNFDADHVENIAVLLPIPFSEARRGEGKYNAVLI